MVKKTDKPPEKDTDSGTDATDGRQPYEGVRRTMQVEADLRIIERKHPDPLEKGPAPGIGSMQPPGG